MLRRILIFAAAVGCHAMWAAAIWPEQLWDQKRASVAAIAIEDKPVWEEYGLEAAEQAQYPSFRVRGYRLKDPTSALAVYQWLKPAGAAPSKVEAVAVQSASRTFLLRGNYVLDFDGRHPTEKELEVLYLQLQRFDNSALPVLPKYLPPSNRTPGSERYVLGPESLAKFFPGVPPSVASFSMGAEAQVGQFQSAAGPVNMAIFAYPTPQIARERLTHFQTLPGAVAKRSGALVAITMGSPSPDESEKLLAKVNQIVTLTWNEKIGGSGENPGAFLLNVFIFIGVLIGLVIVSGVAYGFIRVGWRRMMGRSNREEPEAMLTLHLGDK